MNAMVLPIEFQDLSRTKSNDHIHIIFFIRGVKVRRVRFLIASLRYTKMLYNRNRDKQLIDCSMLGGPGVEFLGIATTSKHLQMFNWK